MKNQIIKTTLKELVIKLVFLLIFFMSLNSIFLVSLVNSQWLTIISVPVLVVEVILIMRVLRKSIDNYMKDTTNN